MTECRLLNDAPSSGCWNMAVDQVLLENASADRSTLRFYQWESPTLSLGYFQHYSDRQQHSTSLNCPCVRRASGGGAILHDYELTYSYATPSESRVAEQQAALYDAFHESLINVLKDFGVDAISCETPQNAQSKFLCFQRHTIGDVLLDNHKITGSAQRRFQQGTLQHGSILLRQSTAAPELPGIYELTGIDLTAEALIQAWLPRLSSELQSDFVGAQLSSIEAERVEIVRQEKFGSQRWNQKK